MNVTDIALVITGCIEPIKEQSWLTISDPFMRLRQYVDSIKFYIKDNTFHNIIFCDNSAYKYDDVISLYDLANKNNTNFEWLSFKGNPEKVLKYGKGAGEDEIMAYVLEHSKIMQRVKSFAKTTGRLTISNINAVMRSINPKQNYFVRDIYMYHLKAVDTRFYVCDRDYFEKHLMNCYSNTIINQHNLALEEAYWYLLKGEYKCFHDYPLFNGKSGGNGRNYSKELPIVLLFLRSSCSLHIFNKIFSVLWAFRKICIKITKLI